MVNPYAGLKKKRLSFQKKNGKRHSCQFVKFVSKYGKAKIYFSYVK